MQRPVGELSSGRQTEWESYVRRLAGKACSSAEVATVKRGVATLRELQHFQVARGREGLDEVDRVDLEAFIHQAKAPHRAVAGLRWVVKCREASGARLESARGGENRQGGRIEKRLGPKLRHPL